jgi:hypothetical protein
MSIDFACSEMQRTVSDMLHVSGNRLLGQIVDEPPVARMGYLDQIRTDLGRCDCHRQERSSGYESSHVRPAKANKTIRLSTKTLHRPRRFSSAARLVLVE